jgi:starch phosphorylase
LLNLGYDLDKIYELEPEQGLGMSGLGRLSVSIMEGLTTQNIPAIGYGIRYDYGSFTQSIDENGCQVEIPDFLPSKGIPWEIPRQDVCYTI